MKRLAIKDLYKWKENKRHKPLIIKGARQVGKTWLIKEFAKEAYEKSVYINFEEDEMLQNVFLKDFDTKRIITTISLAIAKILLRECSGIRHYLCWVAARNSHA